MKTILSLIILIVLSQATFATSAVSPNAETRLKSLSDRMKWGRETMGWVGIGVGALTLYIANTSDNSQKSTGTALSLLSIGSGILALNIQTDAERSYQKVSGLSEGERDASAKQAIKTLSDAGFLGRMLNAGVYAGIALIETRSEAKSIKLAGGIFTLLTQSPAETTYHDYQKDIAKSNLSLAPSLEINKDGLLACYKMKF